MVVTHLVLFDFFTGATSSTAAAPGTTRDYSSHGVVVPPDAPGAAVRAGDRRFDPQVDRDFQALARMQELNLFLEDVDAWARRTGLTEGEEYEDPFENPLEEPEDDELLGPRRRRSVRSGNRPRVNRRRGS